MSTPASLSDLRDCFADTATDEQRQAVSDAFDDPDSDLREFCRHLAGLPRLDPDKVWVDLLVSDEEDEPPG